MLRTGFMHQTAVDSLSTTSQMPDPFLVSLTLCLNRFVAVIQEYAVTGDYRDYYSPQAIDLSSSELMLSRPEGVPGRLAETILDIFDLCTAYDINIEKALEDAKTIRSHPNARRR